MINPEHIRALLDLVNRGPYFRLLSIEVCELGVGYSKVEVALRQKHMNNFGAIHGGVYSSILDVAAYWAVYCELDEDVSYTSLDLSINNLAMVKEGKITVTGSSVRVGRSICIAEAAAVDDHGKMLAFGTSKLMVPQGKQSMRHAVEVAGFDPLPPKFLK